MSFNVGDAVLLVSFLGTESPDNAVANNENYWFLIGKKGFVVQTEAQACMRRHPLGERVLVRFETDMRKLGLDCHSQIPNGLWVFVADLRGLHAS